MGWRSFLKYFIFIFIFIGIFVILFTTLYNIDGNSGNIFIELNRIIRNSSLRFLLPLIVLLIMIAIIFNSILIGRMLRAQGQKVKIRHLIISSIIGIVISNITPLSIGGDLAGYWYLRRKSFERGPLIATYLASSLLYQVVGAIMACIFVPMGFFAYSEILNFSNPKSIIIIILALIGFIGNIIGAIFIGVFSFSKKAQNIFIRIWIKLVELNPFIISRDQNLKVAGFQYEFDKIRTSSLLIFKKVSYTIEFIFWRISSSHFKLNGDGLIIISDILRLTCVVIKYNIS